MVEEDYDPQDFYGVSSEDREQMRADFDKWVKQLKEKYHFNDNTIKNILHEILMVVV